MAETTTPASVRDGAAATIARLAGESDAFRAALLADPAAALAKLTGVAAASLPRIVVHEEQPGTWHLVIPAKPAAAGELSEAELAKVAGGTGGFSPSMTADEMLAFQQQLQADAFREMAERAQEQFANQIIGNIR
jgi:uncharacterized protein YbjQ (UPF0145 family)